MPIYSFIVDDDDVTFDDMTGVVLADDQAARDCALRIVAELKADARFANCLGDMIVMQGSCEILRIPFWSVPRD
jgi:uncharacterized protein DUF6894